MKNVYSCLSVGKSDLTVLKYAKITRMRSYTGEGKKEGEGGGLGEKNDDDDIER